MTTKERIKTATKAQGRNLNWLGQQVGVADRRTFDSKLTRGNLSADQKARIAEILGVSECDLFPEPEPTPAEVSA